MTEKVSLFDYLGHPAGPALGKQVAEYAKARKAKFGTRNVETKAYTGMIYTYEPEFLKEYFEAKKVFEPKKEDFTEINTELIQDSYKAFEDELPF